MSPRAISSGELAHSRAAYTAQLPDSCTIQRYSDSADNAGGYPEAWTADPAPIACRVAPTGEVTEAEIGERTANVQVYLITLAAGTSLAAPDQIVWNTGGGTFQVLGPGGRTRELSHPVRCVKVS